MSIINKTEIGQKSSFFIVDGHMIRKHYNLLFPTISHCNKKLYLTTRGSNLLAATAWPTTRLSLLETFTQLKDYLPTIHYLEYGTAGETYGCNLWHHSLYGLHLLLIKHMETPHA